MFVPSSPAADIARSPAFVSFVLLPIPIQAVDGDCDGLIGYDEFAEAVRFAAPDVTVRYSAVLYRAVQYSVLGILGGPAVE